LEYFLAFNYDLLSGSLSTQRSVTQIRSTLTSYICRSGNSPNWLDLRIHPVSEVVFTYLTCVECKEETVLSALRFDPAGHKWEIRNFGNGIPKWWMTRGGVVVGKDANDGGDTLVLRLFVSRF
jgi:hypothetical protein